MKKKSKTQRLAELNSRFERYLKWLIGSALLVVVLPFLARADNIDSLHRNYHRVVRDMAKIPDSVIYQSADSMYLLWVRAEKVRLDSILIYLESKTK